MDRRAVGRVGRAQDARGAEQRPGLAGAEQPQVVLAAAPPAGVVHLAPGSGQLRAGAGQHHGAALGVVGVDPLGGHARPTSSTVSRIAACWASAPSRSASVATAVERGREQRRAPAAVASGGAEAGHLRLEHDDPQRRVGRGQVVRRPEPGEARADDRDVGVAVAGQRWSGRPVGRRRTRATGQRAVPPRVGLGSANAPRVGLLVQLEVHERLGGRARRRWRGSWSEISSSRWSSLSADHLGEQVVGAGGDHDVVDLLERGEGVGDRLDLAVDPDADHRLPGEAELERVGDRDDLHDAAVGEPLHALADGGLGQPDDLADGGVRAAAVLLELLDDRLRDVVEDDWPRRPGSRAGRAARVARDGAWGASSAASRPRVTARSPGDETLGSGKGFRRNASYAADGIACRGTAGVTRSARCARLPRGDGAGRAAHAGLRRADQAASALTDAA